jgi:hypothetical protein
MTPATGVACVHTGIRYPNCGCYHCCQQLFDDFGRVNMETQYERITCDDVEVGDSIARAKTHTFHEIIEIHEGPVSRRLCWTKPNPGARRDWGQNIRPRRDAKLWRIAR